MPIAGEDIKTNEAVYIGADGKVYRSILNDFREPEAVEPGETISVIWPLPENSCHWSFTELSQLGQGRTHPAGTVVDGNGDPIENSQEGRDSTSEPGERTNMTPLDNKEAVAVFGPGKDLAEDILTINELRDRIKQLTWQIETSQESLSCAVAQLTAIERRASQRCQAFLEQGRA